MTIFVEKFHEIYYLLVNILLPYRDMEIEQEASTDRVIETNRRTGEKISASPAGFSFSLDLCDQVIPTIGYRKATPIIAAAELAWCLQGHNHLAWLRRYTKVWDDFADWRECVVCDGSGLAVNYSALEEDGKILGMSCTNCDGIGKFPWLMEAYGYRWRGSFGIDQLQTALDRLRVDSTDRRCWVSSWDPSEDIEPKNQKTVPCPVGFTLSILNGRLNSTLMIRSSDVYMGLPHDVARHSLLMAACAAELGVKIGHARFTLAHPHLYERHWDICREMLKQTPAVPQMLFFDQSVSGITKLPDLYVGQMKAYCQAFDWPRFAPKSEVVR